MNYEKAMKHSRSHRKDRYYQQCGFSVSSPEPSYSTVAEITASAYYVGEIETKKPVSEYYNDDVAVDFYRSLTIAEQLKCGIFTNRGFLIMK